MEYFFGTPKQQQLVKSKIVSEYFGPWSRIVLPHARSHNQSIAYVDLFAGPGRFDDGSPSTPLWILEQAIRDADLRRNLVAAFNDENPHYIERLHKEITSLPGIEWLANAPLLFNNSVGRDPIRLQEIFDLPALYFLDPFGYKAITLDLLRTCIRNWGSECIFFFNYDRINRGISNPLPYVVTQMNCLFGADRANRLREEVMGRHPWQRQEMILEAMDSALREIGGSHVLRFEFQSPHGRRPSHYIYYVAKHVRGYNIMKDIMAKLSSDMNAVKRFVLTRESSQQLPLFGDTSISALMDLLVTEFAGQVWKVSDIYDTISPRTPYLLSHVQDAITSLERQGRVEVDVAAGERPKRNGAVTLGRERIIRFKP